MKKIVNSGILRGFCWMISLTVLTGCILYAIEKNYNIYAVDQDSCSTYRIGIWCMFGITIFLSFLWWGIAASKWKVKEHMENRTQKWVIGFISVCLLAAVIIYCIFPGVYLNSRKLKRVIYVFSYPCILGMNLFAASPKNVYKVILPYAGGIIGLN